MNAPRPSPCQFSLRKLMIVVALLCILLAERMNRVYERKELLRQDKFGDMWQIWEKPKSELRWWRKISGDTEVFAIAYSKAPADELARMKAAFPEAAFIDRDAPLEDSPGRDCPLPIGP